MSSVDQVMNSSLEPNRNRCGESCNRHILAQFRSHNVRIKTTWPEGEWIFCHVVDVDPDDPDGCLQVTLFDELGALFHPMMVEVGDQGRFLEVGIEDLEYFEPLMF